MVTTIPEQSQAGLQVRVAHASQSGPKPRNADAVSFSVPENALELQRKGVVVAISDGISSDENGRGASRICVQGFISDYYSTPDSWSVKTSGRRVLAALNQWFCSQSHSSLANDNGFVTTFSALCLHSQTAHIFHVGDTRIYRCREGELEQLTHDHTMQLGRRGSYLARSLGSNPQLEIDYDRLGTRAGDVFVLTSDGVHDYLTDTEILSILRLFSDDLDKACEQLITKALAKDSQDNVSCVLVDVVALGAISGDDMVLKYSQLPFPPALTEGSELDGLRVLHLHYESPRKKLYRVEDIETGERYVMKTPSVFREDDQDYIERFIYEEWVGQRIHHPNVVKVISPDRPRRCLYYLTEYDEGISIREWINDYCSVDPAQAVAWVDVLAKALRAFHRQELIHQRLDPEDIIINNEGEPVIADVSAFRMSEVDRQGRLRLSRKERRSYYASPEFKMGLAPSPQSDQFTLAVILYELLTGKLPYGSRYSPSQSFSQFSQLHYLPAFEANSSVPVWMDGVLKRALSMAPNERYPSLSEFVNALRVPKPDGVKADYKELLRQTHGDKWKKALWLSLLVNLALLVALLW